MLWDERLIQVREAPGFKPKTREEREIPMSDRVHEALYPVRQEEGWIFQGRAGEDKTPYRFDPKRGVIEALERAGLSTEKPFQRLRISWCTLMIAQGYTLQQVVDWAGNSPRTLENHYKGRIRYDVGTIDVA